MLFRLEKGSENKTFENPQQLLQFSSSRPTICREHADDVGTESDESISYTNWFGGGDVLRLR